MTPYYITSKIFIHSYGVVYAYNKLFNNNNHSCGNILQCARIFLWFVAYSIKLRRYIREGGKLVIEIK